MSDILPGKYLKRIFNTILGHGCWLGLRCSNKLPVEGEKRGLPMIQAKEKVSIACLAMFAQQASYGNVLLAFVAVRTARQLGSKGLRMLQKLLEQGKFCHGLNKLKPTYLPESPLYAGNGEQRWQSSQKNATAAVHRKVGLATMLLTTGQSAATCGSG